MRSLTLTPVAAGLLYLNPAHTSPTLSGATPGSAVKVLDALGRQVLCVTADATGTVTLELPTGLGAGLYLVRSSQTARLVTY